jgi:hypothetical protein
MCLFGRETYTKPASPSIQHMARHLGIPIKSIAYEGGLLHKSKDPDKTVRLIMAICLSPPAKDTEDTCRNIALLNAQLSRRVQDINRRDKLYIDLIEFQLGKDLFYQLKNNLKVVDNYRLAMLGNIIYKKLMEHIKCFHPTSTTGL